VVLVDFAHDPTAELRHSFLDPPMSFREPQRIGPRRHTTTLEQIAMPAGHESEARRRPPPLARRGNEIVRD
jgi:hypothetical protein